MPSNRELSGQARSLAQQLGTEVETVGLNNAQLVDLVAELQLRIDVPKDAERVRDPAPISPVQVVEYVVAPGRQLWTKRGSLTSGDVVRTGDVTDGIPQLEKMFANGFLLKS